MRKIKVKINGVWETKLALQECNDWRVPAGWSLPDVANNEINLLVCDVNPYYSFTVTCIGGYTVVWGDGVTESFASNALASHTYTVGAGQSCVRGYTMFRIRIYSTAGNNITRFYIGASPTIYDLYNGILWAKFGTTALTSVQYAFYNSAASLQNYSGMLECIELPSSLTSCTIYSYMCYNSYSLEKVVMPSSYYTGGNINFDSAFYQTYRLLKFSFNTTSINVSLFSSTFNGSGIKSFIFPATVNGCSTYASMFSGSKLESVTLPTTINTNCSCASMFSSCKLTELVFPATFDGRVTDISGLVSSNFPLKKLTLPTTLASTGQATTFASFILNCYLLEYLTLPTNLNISITTLANTFQNMYNLKRVVNFPVLNSVSVLTSTFNNCYSLDTISNLSELGDTTTSFDHASTFAGCYSLPALNCRNKITGRFVLAGVNGTNLGKLASLILGNANSTFAGASPQIDIAYQPMTESALQALANSLPTLSGKMIRITGCTGASATSYDATFTAKGFTINRAT